MVQLRQRQELCQKMLNYPAQCRVMSRESWFLETMTSQRIGQLAVLGELAARSIIWRFSFWTSGSNWPKVSGQPSSLS